MGASFHSSLVHVHISIGFPNLIQHLKELQMSEGPGGRVEKVNFSLLEVGHNQNTLVALVNMESWFFFLAGLSENMHIL